MDAIDYIRRTLKNKKGSLSLMSAVFFFKTHSTKLALFSILGNQAPQEPAPAGPETWRFEDLKIISIVGAAPADTSALAGPVYLFEGTTTAFGGGGCKLIINNGSDLWSTPLFSKRLTAYQAERITRLLSPEEDNRIAEEAYVADFFDALSHRERLPVPPKGLFNTDYAIEQEEESDLLPSRLSDDIP